MKGSSVKFQLNDDVRIIETGEEGYISSIVEDEDCPYGVVVDGDEVYFNEEELELINE
jgi:hypothetical protein